MSLTGTKGVSYSGRQRCLEFAVPVIPLGFTLAGILLWQLGVRIDFQYFALGCLIGSCILAYLAWIRPRKDIVALSTPLYAFIFFVVPSDYTAGVVFQLLYAVSLAILLVRLKYRFGDHALPASAGERGPPEEYADRVRSLLPPVPPALAGDAGTVFIRFAEGEYELVARLAAAAGETCSSASGPGMLGRAFLIVAEQAGNSLQGISEPAGFRSFSPEDSPLLFHRSPASAGADYTVTLDNALLLLYAVAWNDPAGNGNVRLGPLRPFALRLMATG